MTGGPFGTAGPRGTGVTARPGRHRGRFGFGVVGRCDSGGLRSGQRHAECHRCGPDPCAVPFRRPISRHDLPPSLTFGAAIGGY